MTRGLFLFEIPAVFYQLGQQSHGMDQAKREAYVKEQLEIRAYDTYHSLMWREAERAALVAFEDGYRHNGYSYR